MNGGRGGKPRPLQGRNDVLFLGVRRKLPRSCSRKGSRFETSQGRSKYPVQHLHLGPGAPRRRLAQQPQFPNEAFWCLKKPAPVYPIPAVAMPGHVTNSDLRSTEMMLPSIPLRSNSAACTDASPTLFAREASAAPAAYLIRAFWKVANLRDRSPYLASWRITPVKRRSRQRRRRHHGDRRIV